MSSVFEKLSQLEETAEGDYWKLVRKLAEGGDGELDRTQQILSLTSRTANDLRRDVSTHQHYQSLLNTKSEVEAANAELPALHAKIAAIETKMEAARVAGIDEAAPIHVRIGEIRALSLTNTGATNELARTKKPKSWKV